jgi:uncharacterized protein (TIGR02145 family)
VIYFLNSDFYMKCFLIPKLMLLSKIAMSQIMLPAYQGVVSKIPAVVTPSFSCGPSTVSDINGNIYNTVLINTQCWMASNLRVTTYNNGNTIPEISASSTWPPAAATGVRTVYNDLTINLTNYGYLYNWYAITDSRKVCPTGWHIPLDTEWTALTTFLGGLGVAGGKIKSTGTSLWYTPNTGAVNSSGFSALPGGFRNNDGSFGGITKNAYFWSATSSDTTIAWFRNLAYNYSNIWSYNNGYKLSLGFSVRCLRD